MVTGGSLGASLTSGSGLIWFLPLLFPSVSLIVLLVVLGFFQVRPGLMKNSERPGFPTFEFNEEVEGWPPLLPFDWVRCLLMLFVVRVPLPVALMVGDGGS